MGGASILNRLASVSLKEKMALSKDSKELREFTYWISRGRISRQKLETATAGTQRQQLAWHTQTTARKPHVGQQEGRGKLADWPRS